MRGSLGEGWNPGLWHLTHIDVMSVTMDCLHSAGGPPQADAPGRQRGIQRG